MKAKTHIALLAAFLAPLVLAACAGPARRHDIRTDRREDAAARTENRVTTRQDNRYERRGERHDRMESRGY